jgi:hypothetical protein
MLFSHMPCEDDHLMVGLEPSVYHSDLSPPGRIENNHRADIRRERMILVEGLQAPPRRRARC